MATKAGLPASWRTSRSGRTCVLVSSYAAISMSTSSPGLAPAVSAGLYIWDVIVQRIRPVLAGYLIAVISIAAATGITFAIQHAHRFRAGIGFAYILAVLASAWCGYGPGLLTCALG